MLKRTSRLISMKLHVLAILKYNESGCNDTHTHTHTQTHTHTHISFSIESGIGKFSWMKWLPQTPIKLLFLSVSSCPREITVHKINCICFLKISAHKQRHNHSNKQHNAETSAQHIITPYKKHTKQAGSAPHAEHQNKLNTFTFNGPKFRKQLNIKLETIQ